MHSVYRGERVRIVCIVCIGESVCIVCIVCIGGRVCIVYIVLYRIHSVYSVYRCI